MNDRNYEMILLFNGASSGSTLQTGAYVDMGATYPSASVAKREMKLITVANGVTYQTATQASWPIYVEECASTDGTYTTVAGDTPTAVSTDGVSTCHIRPKYRYLRAGYSTVGTGGTSANIAVLLMNLKRTA